MDRTLLNILDALKDCAEHHEQNANALHAASDEATDQAIAAVIATESMIERRISLAFADLRTQILIQ